MTAPEPLGPALAAELGGEWQPNMRGGSVLLRSGCSIICRTTGDVWLETDDDFVGLGSFSDGAPALARRARRLGVA